MVLSEPLEHLGDSEIVDGGFHFRCWSAGFREGIQLVDCVGREEVVAALLADERGYVLENVEAAVLVLLGVGDGARSDLAAADRAELFGCRLCSFRGHGSLRVHGSCHFVGSSQWTVTM